VDEFLGERLAKSYGATVGREMNRDTSFAEYAGERRCREQMTAGPAGRDQHRRFCFIHYAGLVANACPPVSWARGRSRVSATSMPIP